MANNQGRPGSIRKVKKGAGKGTGGLGRKSLEGKGPTPKAEDRTYHVAGKRKLAQDRLATARGGRVAPKSSNRADTDTSNAPQGGRRPKAKSSDDVEIVTGRNSVYEALKAGIPATTLYVATRIDYDERVKEIIKMATARGIPMLEVMRTELDRMTSFDSVHQGVAIKVPPYKYEHPEDLLQKTISRGQKPLFVALDGITDPRNLGAILRSTAAFGGQGVIVPQRRSVGLTASAWKTSAGAAARTPVAMAANLNATIKAFKAAGVFVIGLDGDGDTMLPGLPLAERPILIVVGSEGKGLSRLVAENCDAIVSIPISAATESLNAGIAASVTLYEISRLRAEAKAAKLAAK